MWKGRRSFRRAAFDPTLGYWLGESPVRIRLSRQSKTAAYIDLGDQFLALQRGRTQAADDGCHFGPVADVEHFGRMDRIATFAYERDLAVCSTQEQLLALLPSVSEQM